MESDRMALLAQRIQERRAGKGIREAAKEVGVSPATLSRVENGKVPDLDTFGKVCRWLDEDPALYLGMRPSAQVSIVPKARVHFKKGVAIKPDSAKALSEMILLTQKALLEEELEGLTLFERGFKTWCEKYATDKRKELGLSASAPLDTRALAKHLGVRVWTPSDVSGLSTTALDVLLRNDGKTPSCWSAVTVIAGSRVVVILNSSHSPARQASDLTHELAHRIRGHEAQEVEVSAEGLMLLKSYDKLQEDEADWLSSCLLLPRDALLAIKRRRLDDADAATEYGVSMRMLGYRMARTGVNKQFA